MSTLTTKTNFLFNLIISISLLACAGDAKQKENAESLTEKATELRKNADPAKLDAEGMTKNGIALKPIGTATEFENAQLSLARVDSKTEGVTKFNFKVENFDLASQTEDERSKRLANSSKGQHIHFILNNGPYSARYQADFETELSEGNNVVLAFLSRSYHESVKSPGAFVFKNFAIGKDLPSFDEKAPHLIYSRPKGEYNISEKHEILLDFYLLNASLSKAGMKVKATIDQEEFILNSWQAYAIEGLVEGEHTVRLQLIDEDGKVVPGPFNDSGQRTIVIKKNEDPA